MRGIWRAILVSTLACVLGSCGGGGGGNNSGGPTPTPVSTAPRFTSGGTASVVENLSGSFYTATASDPQGDPISFSISGGPDADKFVLDSNGNLRFDRPPNFDLPIDAGRDNVYSLTLRASAGGETASLSLVVTVTNDREGVKVTRAVAGLPEAIDMSFIHNAVELLVATADGRVLRVNPETGTSVEDVFIRDNRVAGDILAISYGFPSQAYQEGIYIVTHSPAEGLWLQGFDASTGRIFSQKLGDGLATAPTASIISQNELYVAIGDPAGNLAQNSSSPYGKLFKVGVVCLYCQASLPRPGKLVGLAALWGDGIQSPGGFSPQSDYLILADRGSTNFHELNRFRRDWQPLDFGWPFYEGATPLSNDPPAAVNGPYIVYPLGEGRVAGEGVVAGLFNDGNFLEALGMNYIFGDVNGSIFAAPRGFFTDGILHGADEIENRTEDFAPDIGMIDSPVAFASGRGTSHFFILDQDGEIFRVESE